MRCFLCLEEALLLGLWVPGLVFCCLAGGRRETLLRGDEMGFCRLTAEEVELVLEVDLVDVLLPFTDGLGAIAKACREGATVGNVWKGKLCDKTDVDAKISNLGTSGMKKAPCVH